jgi:hypothetical protein
VGQGVATFEGIIEMKSTQLMSLKGGMQSPYPKNSLLSYQIAYTTKTSIFTLFECNIPKKSYPLQNKSDEMEG